jgi:hypothetical protein
MEVRGAPARAGCAAALHHMAPRVPRFAHAIHTRHTRHASPIARSCGRLQGTQFMLHAFLHFLHNSPTMVLHIPTTFTIFPHTPASSITHSGQPDVTACDTPIDNLWNFCYKQVQHICTLSCSISNTFHKPMATSMAAPGLHESANITHAPPTASERPSRTHTAAFCVPALPFIAPFIAAHLLHHNSTRTSARSRDRTARHLPAQPIPTAAGREPATRGDLAPHNGSGRANTRPSIDHPSTIYRPSIDHPPTIHRPPIDQHSTQHSI